MTHKDQHRSDDRHHRDPDVESLVDDLLDFGAAGGDESPLSREDAERLARLQARLLAETTHTSAAGGSSVNRVRGQQASAEGGPIPFARGRLAPHDRGQTWLAQNWLGWSAAASLGGLAVLVALLYSNGRSHQLADARAEITRLQQELAGLEKAWNPNSTENGAAELPMEKVERAPIKALSGPLGTKSQVVVSPNILKVSVSLSSNPVPPAWTGKDSPTNARPSEPASTQPGNSNDHLGAAAVAPESLAK